MMKKKKRRRIARRGTRERRIIRKEANCRHSKMDSRMIMWKKKRRKERVNNQQVKIKECLLMYSIAKVRR